MNESFVDFYCRWNLFCLMTGGGDELDEKLVNQDRVLKGIPSIYEEEIPCNGDENNCICVKHGVPF